MARVCAGSKRYSGNVALAGRLTTADVAGQQHVALGVEPRHAGMLGLGRAIDALRLELAVIGVLLSEAEHGQDTAARLAQGNLLALAQRLCLLGR